MQETLSKPEILDAGQESKMQEILEKIKEKGPISHVNSPSIENVWREIQKNDEEKSNEWLKGSFNAGNYQEIRSTGSIKDLCLEAVGSGVSKEQIEHIINEFDKTVVESIPSKKGIIVNNDEEGEPDGTCILTGVKRAELPEELQEKLVGTTEDITGFEEKDINLFKEHGYEVIEK